jgi:hypothetical protein
MATWKRLTMRWGAKVDVNMDHVAYMIRGTWRDLDKTLTDVTNVVLVVSPHALQQGQDEKVMLQVKETPDEIHKLDPIE